MSVAAPQFSIIMSVRAPAPWLVTTLASIKAQRDVSWQLCIVADGEADEIRDALSCVGLHAELDAMAPDSGPAKCRNQALSLATAPLVAVIDADDVWDPDHLATHARAFGDAPEIVLRGSWARPIDSDGADLGPLIRTPRHLMRHQLLLRNCFVHSAVAFRRDLAVEVGGYAEELRFGEDYDLWMRLAALGDIANDSRVTVSYRRHSGQTSSRAIEPREVARLLQSRRELAHRLRVPQTIADGAHRIWLSRQRVAPRK